MRRSVWLMVGVLSVCLGVAADGLFDFSAPEQPKPDPGLTSLGVLGNKDIFLTDMIEGNNTYLKVYADIFTAPANSVVNIHLFGYGGSADSMIHFINVIQSSNTKVKMYIEGPVYSAHAIIPLVAVSKENLFIADNSLFMLHKVAVMMSDSTYTTNISVMCASEKGIKDRGQDNFIKCINMRKAQEVVYNRIYEKLYPFMTKQEIIDFKSGKDIYIDGVEMKRRIAEMK